MIRRHLGGLYMIDAVLATSGRPEVVDLAAKMTSSQRAGITVQRMLADMGATR